MKIGGFIISLNHILKLAGIEGHMGGRKISYKCI